ncbi:Hypothetical protein SCLAV_0741 [Streptomyces clavuligerus]|uniref:Uncharacterized protein n=1 Tax=Streptomyces clavuligerus TaxID=1901 RepID=E2PV70_STRCL|nr:Hypothetical protein SCLAV_0741 [Streptomyces clavuligerus]
MTRLGGPGNFGRAECGQAGDRSPRLALCRAGTARPRKLWTMPGGGSPRGYQVEEAL